MENDSGFNTIIEKLTTDFIMMENRFDSYLYELNNAIFDYELILKGYKLYYAMDFYNLFLHIFPFYHETFNPSLNKKLREEKRLEFIKINMANSYVFSDLEKNQTIMLLPPHIIELENNIVWSQGTCLNKFKKEMIEKYQYNLDKILDSKERIKIDEIKRWYDENENETIPDEYYTFLQDIIFTKYRNIFLLLTGYAAQGITKVKSLVLANKLELSPSQLEDYKHIIEETIKNQNSIWYRRYSNQRSDPVKEPSNYRDAKVIDIVKSLNSEFIQNDDKAFIYVFSDVHATKKVIKDYPDEIKLTIPSIDENSNILRTADFFTTIILNKEENAVNTLEKLKASRESIYEFFAIRPMIYEVQKIIKEGTLTNKDMKKIQNMEAILQKQRETYDELEKFRLIETRMSYLSDCKDYNSIKFKFIDVLSTLAKFLCDVDNMAFKNAIDKNVNKLETDIYDFQSKLDVYIIQFTDQSIDALAYYVRSFVEIPFKVNFFNETIDEELKNLIVLLKKALKFEPTNDEYIDLKNELKDTALKVIQMSKDSSLGPSKDLLLATLLCNCANYYDVEYFKGVIYITTKALADSTLNDKYKKEHKLLRASALHKLGIHQNNTKYYSEAIQICDDMIDDNEATQVPRFYYLRAVIIGRGIEKGIERKWSFDNAINFCKTAQKHIMDDVGLKLALLNNISYFISLKKDVTLDDLKKALKNMDDLKMELPINEWKVTFLDTRAWILKKIVEIDEKMIQEEKINYIDESLFLIKRAKSLGEKYGLFLDLAIITPHYEVIKELKEDLASK